VIGSIDSADSGEALDVMVVWYFGMRRCGCTGQHGDRNEWFGEAHGVGESLVK
jgi:hypothetical protein